MFDLTNRQVIEQMVINAKNMEPVWQTDRSYRHAVYYRSGEWFVGIPRVSVNDPSFDDYQETCDALVKAWNIEDANR